MVRSDFENLLAGGERLLAEGSVYELLRRDPRIEFDPRIAHAGLIYEDTSRSTLAAVHRAYMDVAERFNLPLLAFADTWRASGERIAASRFRGRDVNGDNVRFLRAVAAESPASVFVGALTGPRGDAYKPEESPDFETARALHAPQIDALAASGVDLMMAATLPAFEEAKAIASLMARTGRPWMLSFVVRPESVLLDGTPLAHAIAAIDDSAPAAPVGYSINCVHPEVARSALAHLPVDLRGRVIAFQGNTSMLSPEEVDGRSEIDTMDPHVFATSVAALIASTDIRIIGGCCGTNEHHLGEIAKVLRQQHPTSLFPSS